MTEEEAKTKWCPMVRLINPKSDRAGNRLHSGLEDPPIFTKSMLCIGSACMAWRWFDTLSDDGTQCQLKPSPHAKRDPLPPLSPLEHRRGYCGAFGKVEP